MLSRTTPKTIQDLPFGRRSRDGYTLAEMLVAAAVLAVVGVSMGALFSAGLRVYEVGQDRDSRCRNAERKMCGR